jgi:hypothetical protein
MTSAVIGPSSPRPVAPTMRTSRPSVGSARSPFASPTTANPPRPVWPIHAPTGTAITSAISSVNAV